MARHGPGTSYDSDDFVSSSVLSDIKKLTNKIEKATIKDDKVSIMTVNVSNAKKSGCVKAAERRNFVSTLINALYPDTVLLQESIKKDFDEVNNKVKADSKKVYTYYYKDQNSGVMVKKCIEILKDYIISKKKK